MIRIINLRNYNAKKDEVAFRVDRRSPVGNPFYMHNESERDLVCDRYIEYFNSKINQEGAFRDYINTLIETAKNKDIALCCWCYPKRCHSETIKEYIISQIKA